ncbi:23S rRNA (uracil(1939)-C(5))-methyltransferase RlmD [Vibrio stylophorae]|uniref:23S rRNA (uracil(1939)-C(5))-methyltransferase RlmD n=1 Tax=Vibrio stylophorae TaxID=659351 RepID=A0ABM8ZVJ4_9VIBR|nr:23S rRNA (uracil(1939)-C(5))-methyltransferase RlmD [Vibrio stylophorae]CAH0534359.1 23S rRNA (uracil(1939)-C(5))-methyltransferase RlmD [Vibrio stylophorae]
MARFFKPTPRKKSVSQQHQTMQVERLDHQGVGIAHWQGKAVFIPGALAGESVLAQIIEDKRRYAQAKLIRILEPSADRVAPACPHYGRCGGCNLQHLPHDAQVAHKQQSLAQLMRQGGDAAAVAAQAQPVEGDCWHYRRSARLSIAPNHQGEYQLGFRARASKEVVVVDDCPVLAAELNALLPQLQALVAKHSQKRALGHIQLALLANGVQLSLRHQGPMKACDQALWLEFAKQHQLNFYFAESSKDYQCLLGHADHYEVAQCQIAVGPNDFMQVNAKVNSQMVAQALDWLALKSSDRVLDLFCGLGNFTLPLAKHVQQVIGVEGVEEMVLRARENAKAQGINNAQFYHADLSADVSKFDWAQQGVDKVLLDPARAGAREVMSQIITLAPTHIVYVSCHSATMARDSEALYAAGYRLVRLGMLDMFPHTGHLESMALFVRET